MWTAKTGIPLNNMSADRGHPCRSERLRCSLIFMLSAGDRLLIIQLNKLHIEQEVESRSRQEEQHPRASLHHRVQEVLNQVKQERRGGSTLKRRVFKGQRVHR